MDYYSLDHLVLSEPWVWQQTQLNLPLLRAGAQFAGLSYYDTDVARQRLPSWDIDGFERGHSYVMFASNDYSHWISIRGTGYARYPKGLDRPPLKTPTENLHDLFSDWKQNLTVYKVKDGGMPGFVHAGFKAVADALYPIIERKIQTWRGDGRPVRYACHSLGAAAALLLLPRQPMIKECYFYGSPRAADKAWLVSLKRSGQRIYRCSAWGDIVTKIPSAWRWGFPQPVVLISSDNTLTITSSPAVAAKVAAVNAWDALFQFRLMREMVGAVAAQNHHIERRYIAGLLAARL